MDAALLAAHTELKASKRGVLQAIRSTPFHDDMVQVYLLTPTRYQGFVLLDACNMSDSGTLCKWRNR